ncbi:MAG: NTP transferase domain-containing protein [Bacteroidales bacterium]|nr:NTP transferase domain-containing protein [Bacteroidales bacterium]
MNYAIIAAGEGSRLRKEGFKSVKPLVQIKGEYLIERLIRIFKDNRAESISIIINEESTELKSYLDSKDWGVKINLIVKSTPSSLHSFWNIIQNTGITECCLTTVDTIFNERDFKEYISAFQTDRTVDALMGVTEYIDDEKPLYVQTDENNNILAFCDTKDAAADNKAASEENNTAFDENNTPRQQNNTPDYFAETPYFSDKVSAGIYCLRNKAIDKADDCIKKNVSRMRNYQRSLIEANLKVKAFLFSKVIDIDHVEDIQKAEKLLKQFNTKVLCLKRFKDYSPNSQDKDEQIITSVGEKLKKLGFGVEYKNETEVDFNKEYFPYVISMARNPEVIKQLYAWQKKGSVIINSPSSCENCYREKQIRILQNNNISIPKTVIVSTDNDFEGINNIKDFKSWWIKRGDFQTVEAIDVIKVSSLEKTKEILANYNSRGIKTAVISENIDGDIVKFYGVRTSKDCGSGKETGEKTSSFFYMTYPTKDKFGEKINTSPDRIDFNVDKFKDECSAAAMLLDLEIYGGDAAIDTNGNFYIIDMNDFPSFSACKDLAAESITDGFLNKYNMTIN